MKYTKADLEELICIQLDNLSAIHDLLRILRLQNDLLEQANKKLAGQLSDRVIKPYPVGWRSSGS